ncbi:unnamed protein product [Pylaiella littoralis]
MPRSPGVGSAMLLGRLLFAGWISLTSTGASGRQACAIVFLLSASKGIATAKRSASEHCLPSPWRPRRNQIGSRCVGPVATSRALHVCPFLSWMGCSSAVRRRVDSSQPRKLSTPPRRPPPLPPRHQQQRRPQKDHPGGVIPLLQPTVVPLDPSNSAPPS